MLLFLLAMSFIASSQVFNSEVSDGFALNFALTLEYLQQALYESGLSKFTQNDFVYAGFEDPFYANLQQIHRDEQGHAAFLDPILATAGFEPTGPVEYDFPYTDVSSFVTLASIIEGLCVSA